MDNGFTISECIPIKLQKVKSRRWYLLCVLQFFIHSIVNAQNGEWPVNVYGGNGAAYGTAPVINGYLILNSKNLKGLVHRTYLKGATLDTLLNSDTLYGRVKLYMLDRRIDIELSKTSVVSVPAAYIISIVGASTENLNKNIPLTRWVILSPDKYPPFGRLIAQNGNVILYDCSKADTVDGGYKCPMTLRNGLEEIEIFSRFYSTKNALRKFIKKRYGADIDLSNEKFQDVRFLINYILEQEKKVAPKEKSRDDRGYLS